MASYRQKKKNIKKKLAAGQALTKSEIKIAVNEYGYNLLYRDMENTLKAFEKLNEEIIKAMVPFCLNFVKVVANVFEAISTNKCDDGKKAITVVVDEFINTQDKQ